MLKNPIMKFFNSKNKEKLNSFFHNHLVEGKDEFFNIFLKRDLMKFRLKSKTFSLTPISFFFTNFNLFENFKNTKYANFLYNMYKTFDYAFIRSYKKSNLIKKKYNKSKTYNNKKFSNKYVFSKKMNDKTAQKYNNKKNYKIFFKKHNIKRRLKINKKKRKRRMKLHL
jgi:hypothetical protein